MRGALVEAQQKAAIIPDLSATKDLQEPVFLDAETTELIATIAAEARDAVISGRRPGVLGWDPTLATSPADSAKSEVKKRGLIRPITGAKDVLDVPKIVQVARLPG